MKKALRLKLLSNRKRLIPLMKIFRLIVELVLLFVFEFVVEQW